MKISKDDIKKYLPHREPFLFVDEVLNINKNSAIAASCAIAGSSIIGENFQMGGLSGVLGHLSICNDVTVGAHTLITKNIEKSGNYVGIMPAQKHQDWAKSSVLIKKLSK